MAKPGPGRPTGIPKTGGRQKGTPNKLTAVGRERFGDFINGHFAKFIGWVQDVAEKDPGKAADLYLRACEFAIPKLARTEVTGQDGEPVRVSIAINGILRDREGVEPAADARPVPRV